MRPRRHASSSAGSTVAGLLLVVGLATAGAPRPEPTLAAFTDAVPVRSTTLTAYTVPKPVITDCSTTLLPPAVTVAFTAVSSPYALSYRAVVVETGQVLTVSGSGGTRTARYPTLGQGVAGGTQTIGITAAPPSASSWTSAPANQVVRFAVLGAAPSCGASS